MADQSLGMTELSGLPLLANFDQPPRCRDWGFGYSALPDLRPEMAAIYRSLYLLTDQRVLLKGTDSGDARVTFTHVAAESPDQMVTTQ